MPYYVLVNSYTNNYGIIEVISQANYQHQIQSYLRVGIFALCRMSFPVDGCRGIVSVARHNSQGNATLDIRMRSNVYITGLKGRRGGTCMLDA